MNWNGSKLEYRLAHEIALRAHRLNANYDGRDAEMDVLAAHLNGCPLELRSLLAAPDVDFAHDIFGIRDHLDRSTGKLQDCFDPRHSFPVQEKR